MSDLIDRDATIKAICERECDALKPCPFCGCGTGNLYIVTIEQHGFDTVGIFCNGCKQTVILEENEWEGDNEQSRIRAIEAWNRRGENE